MNEDKEPHGYLIHANCWTFIEQMIGPRAEQHLELFLRVLRIRWQENPFELSRYVRVDYGVVREDPENDWDQDELLEKYGVDYRMPEFFGLREDNRVYHRARSMFLAKYMFPVWDPLDIPAVHELFRKAAEARARETVKRKTRKWCPLLQLPIEHLRAPSSVLPPEIKDLILDHLPYHKDVRNALYAFGWKIPDSYWRSRFPRDIIFEINHELDPKVEVDWKFLCLKAEELLETSQSLLNRQRIFRVLEGTKKLFFEMDSP